MSKLPVIPAAQLRPMKRKARKPAPVVAKPEVMERPSYTCPELGRTSNRPNAYDAYDLPSLYAGVRKPYRFSQEM